jgi:tetratricopeptide (TPR) repeat protein
MTQAEEAISTTEWDRAIALVQAALAKVDPRKEPEKANRARYYLAFCYYSTKQFYEANVLAEHLARRYPENGLSPKATEIGMQALADAYMTYAEIDRTADLERLIDLAKYTAEAWPDREQGDDAHLNLGQIYQGRGQYDEAFKEFAAVRDRSSKKIEAETRLGGAHWAKSRALDRNGEKDQAAAEAARAIEILSKTLKTRQDAGTGATDPGLIGNAADLATAQTETGHADQALELLKPILEAQTAKSGPLYARLIEANLLAQIHSGQVENAIASMKSLEQSGSSGGRGRLYVELGKLLEKEMSRLRESKNTTALASTQQTYRSFLNAFRESQTEQNYDSLQWAGESLLTIDAGDDAAKALQAALDLAINDPAFQSRPDAKDKILRSKVKLAHAFRIDGKLDRAASLVEEALSQYPRNLEPRMEKGMLLEAQAKAGQAEWGAVFRYWQDLAQKLARNPKPAAYYEAWYQAAGALAQQKETAKARQTLTAIMRLNPAVGGPEMKAKYQKFLDTLK